MFGHLCELPLVPCGALGAGWVVLGVVPVVVCVELAALAIAAAPPAAAPVTASTVTSLVIRPGIMLHLLSVVGQWHAPTIRARRRRVVAGL